MSTKTAILISAFLLAFNLSANTRTALVIGNGAYTNLSALANPGNDARDMASSLTALGFDVQLLVDASHESIEDAVLDFGEKLHKGGGVGLFYYAGHGVQDQGRNYLIPVEANIRRATQLKRKAVDVGWVLDEMAAANNGLNMVILDACRDNPFAEFRSADRGLAKMEGPKGTFIAYATAPGDVAADGEGRNGLFTKHLLSAMQQPDQPVELAFKDVVKAVSDESRGRQTPFITSSLTGDFYFKLGGIAPPEPEAQMHSDTVALGSVNKELISSDLHVKYAGEMVVIKPGSFMMGSNDTEYSSPVHEVTISYSFAIGKYEVTQEQWQAIMSYNPSSIKSDKSTKSDSNRPVDSVNWYDTQLFLRDLNKKLGLSGRFTYRLPSEAEWEYAARAGTTTKFSFGNSEEDLCLYGNTADLSLKSLEDKVDFFADKFSYISSFTPCKDHEYLTSGVGSFRPNPWNLYDMHGNVAEWVEDCYNKGYLGSPNDGQAWLSGDCDKRISRGGSWGFGVDFAWLDSRASADKGYNKDDLGFRIAITLD